MCVSPLRIWNPTRRFVSGASPLMHSVSCRCCADCESAEQDAWFVRAQMEYVRCRRSGGQVWFVTLTYNDDHLPMWHDEQHDFHCQCVDPDLIRHLFAHVRTLLKRLGYDSKSIRYEVVTEYGGEFGRLHHHLLLFVPFSVPEWQMVDVLDRAWAYVPVPIMVDRVITRGKRKGVIVQEQLKDKLDAAGSVVSRYNDALAILMEKYGSYEVAKRALYVRHGKRLSYYFEKRPKNGFVMWSDDGKTIQGASGIRYVQKYITKPQEWIKTYGTIEYEARLKDDIYYWSKCLRSFKQLFRRNVLSVARQRVRDIGEFWRVDPQFAHAYPNLQKEIPLSVDPEKYISARLDAACQLLRDWRRCKPKHFQSTFFGVDAVDYFKNPDGSWNIDALVDGRINLGDTEKYGLFKFVDSKHPNFLYNMPTYIFNKIFMTKDEYELFVKNDLYDQVFERRFAESQSRQVLQYSPYFQTPSALMAHLAPLGLSEPVVSSLWSKIRAYMRGRSVDDLVLYENVYQGRDYEDGMNFIYNEIVAPANFRAPHYDGLSGIELLRAVALPFLHSQHHPEVFVEPSPKRMKMRSRRRKDAFGNPDFSFCFDFSPEFYGFDDVLVIIHDYEKRLGVLSDAAKRLKQERTAQIMKHAKHSRKMSNNSKFIRDYGK